MSTPDDLTREIENLIKRFGKKAVRDRTNEICKGTAGNNPKPDWPQLMQVFEDDARDWLAGRDPEKTRTNYAIAKNFPYDDSNIIEQSKRKRIEKKLRNERKRAMLVGAFWIAERELSWKRFFEVANEAAKLESNVEKLALFYQRELDQYRDHFGEPSDAMTVMEISQQLKDVSVPRSVNVLQTLLASQRR
jgi:hypothetical protein